MRSEVCEVWITYSVKYGTGHQMDREPNTYYNVAFFNTEIEALRYANEHSAKAIQVFSGETLEKSIERDRLTPK